MRKLGSSLVLACLLAACAPPSFDVVIESSGVIEGSSGGLLTELLPPNFGGFNSFDFAATNDFKNSGYPKEQVDSVKLKAFTLTVTAPPGATFDFLDSIAFEIQAEGQPKKRVAFKNPVVRGQNVMTLDLEPLELAPYVRADALSLTTTAAGRPPSKDTTVQGRVVFEVVPKLF